MNFTVDQIGLPHPEANEVGQHGCGNWLLVTLHAVRAGIPQKTLRRNYLDQFLWAIPNEERRQAKAVWAPKCH